MAILVHSDVWAGGACCSAGTNFPSLITNDDRAQIGLSVSGSSLIGISDRSGDVEFYHDEQFDRSLTTSLSGASLISDRFQVGARLPFVFRDVKDMNRESSSSGIGDLSLAFSFEALPQLFYNPWQPKVFLSIGLVLPTGANKYESTETLFSDAVGKGHWTPQINAIALQVWGDWDASVAGLAHYSFAETFESSRGAIKIKPGFGLSSQARLGYSLGRTGLRLGAHLGPQWQQAQKESDQFGERQQAHRLVWDAGLEANYGISSTQSLSLAYQDQTLIGPTNNTELSRGLSLNYRMGWLR